MPARESKFSYGQVESRKLHANPVEFTNYMSPYSVGREYRYHLLTQRRVQTVYPGYQCCYSLGFLGNPQDCPVCLPAIGAILVDTIIRAAIYGRCLHGSLKVPAMLAYGRASPFPCDTYKG